MFFFPQWPKRGSRCVEKPADLCTSSRCRIDHTARMRTLSPNDKVGARPEVYILQRARSIHTCSSLTQHVSGYNHHRAARIAMARQTTTPNDNNAARANSTSLSIT